MKNRVVVAMSGGVDSSVAAYLLKDQGHEVIGVTIKTWADSECKTEKSKGCCSVRDIGDARAVARKLDIPFYVMDLSPDFKTHVMDAFVDEYIAGRTPNPCIECNRHIKFGILLEKAKELNASFVATGHYARKGYDEGQKRFFIGEAADPGKDQSYVLFGLSQEQLEKTLLPIGPMQKSRVRRLAAELGLRVFDKPDSQEICFVKTSYGEFVKKYSPERLPGAGDLINNAGEVLGSHEGYHLFTVGQRKRIRVTNEKPYFVTELRPETNQVVIGFEEGLGQQVMKVGRMSWMLNPKQGEVEVKIRYRHPKTKASITKIEGDEVWVTFDAPQKAITPGQAAVFYDNDRVLGGGYIEKWKNSEGIFGGVAQW